MLYAVSITEHSYISEFMSVVLEFILSCFFFCCFIFCVAHSNLLVMSSISIHSIIKRRHKNLLCTRNLNCLNKIDMYGTVGAGNERQLWTDTVVGNRKPFNFFPPLKLTTLYKFSIVLLGREGSCSQWFHIVLWGF